jgi:Concanavalin A-like lectin/glucanases superfamily/Domain of unknown function (DUF1929)/Glyoxal oxidase N-terminus
VPRRRLPLFALLGFFAVACVPSAAHATTAPVAAYGFEDTGEATVVGDSSAFGHTGTVIGGAARVPGRFGSALQFDGVDDLVRIPDAGPLNLASGMTVEAWVAPRATDGWRTVLAKGRRSDLSFALYGGENPTAYVSAGGGTGSARASSEPEADAWTHLAATYEGTTLRLYVDGVQVAATTERNGPLTPGDGALTVGGNDAWGEWFAGRIDEVRLYDRALTAAELATDMVTPVGGPNTSPSGGSRAELGAWTAPVDWPMVAVHASMLSNGKVAAWDAFDAALDSERIWDPETASFEPTPSGINLFCAGHVLLPDGRLFVAGGHEKSYEGLRSTRLLNPLAGSWAAGPDMSRARWYPTTTTLADGRVLIVSGDSITTGGPNTPFVSPSDTVPEIYDPKANAIAAMPSAARRMPLYPFMFLAPDGRVVDAGPDTTTRILDTHAGQWSTLASRSPIDGHSAVMYRPGMILKSGTWTDTDFPTDVPVTNRAAVLDMNQTTPSWREVAPMKWARTFHTLTVLPDGDVLALAGQSVANANALPDSPVLQPEIWHPASDTWTPVASSVRPRGYHNTSLLLPDGRVLLAGSGRLDLSLMTDETTAEVFSPPYLFKGPRPSIARSPSTLQYGAGFSLETPDAARIAKVSLVRMGAVTHNFNMDQRWQELSFRRAGDRLDVAAPVSANVAPPGVYYVFIIDDKGVPSKAAIVSISGEAAGTAGGAPATVAPAGEGAATTEPVATRGRDEPTAAGLAQGKTLIKARRLPGGRVRLAVAGRLGGPGAKRTAAACRGSLTATVERGARTVATVRIDLARDCRFARTIVLARSQAKHARRLRVTLRFPGNSTWAPERRSYRVRVS